MPGHQWWWMYVPELQLVAMKVLGCSVTASSCERNWSAYGLVQRDQRNRMHPKTAEKLVYAYFNGKLLAKREKVDYELEHFVWDNAEPEGDEEV